MSKLTVPRPISRSTSSLAPLADYHLISTLFVTDFLNWQTDKQIGLAVTIGKPASLERAISEMVSLPFTVSRLIMLPVASY